MIRSYVYVVQLVAWLARLPSHISERFRASNNNRQLHHPRKCRDWRLILSSAFNAIQYFAQLGRLSRPNGRARTARRSAGQVGKKMRMATTTGAQVRGWSGYLAAYRSASEQVSLRASRYTRLKLQAKPTEREESRFLSPFIAFTRSVAARRLPLATLG